MEKFISNVLKITGVLVVIALLYFVRDLIGYLLLAFVFSSALRPGVNWLQRRKIPRFLGGIIVFLLFLIFFGLIFYFALPPLINEIQNFISAFPQYWQNFLLWLPQFEQWTKTTPFGKTIEEGINQSLQKLYQALAQTFALLYTVFGKIVNILFIIIVAFYFTVDEKTSEKFSQFLFTGDKKRKKEFKEKISNYWQLAQKQAGFWLQGYIFLGLIVGTLVYIGLSILRVKYALILAVLAGLLEIVPWLGPVFSGVIGFLLAFLQGGWSIGLWTAFVFFIVQQLENYLIVPLVMKNRVDLDPLLTLILLFIGERIGGVVGMILAIPIGAILLAFLKKSSEEPEPDT